MIRKLLPVILLLIGTGAGVGAGVFLRPASEPAGHAAAGGGDGSHDEEAAVNGDNANDGMDAAHGEAAAPVHGGDHGAEGGTAGRDYVKMSNQFVIPVVENGSVSALVLLALSIEVEAGQRDAIFLREPKLRDSFLQVLFDHANVGGFRGAFTDNNNLEVLRAALREVAIRDAGKIVSDVLIHDIARQDY